MPTSRREFLYLTAAVGGALGFRKPHPSGASPRPRPQGGPLRILILGGTGFIGPHQVRYALARGHEVTLFNRGRTNPGLFPNVETLTGDRSTGDLAALEDRRWDAVIDNSATDPDWVRASASLLRDAADRYLFVSSTGVFLPYLTTDIDESVPPRLEDPDGSTSSYGVRKARCEQVNTELFGDGALNVRPHYIVGPGDPTDRFTYWVDRIDRGGEILAPGHPDDPVQFLDVRDLTEWMIRLLEEQRHGVYNAPGPRARLSVAELLYGLRATTSRDMRFTWVDTDFLDEHGVRHMVPWIPPRGDTLGMAEISGARAVAHGLTYRPLAVTATDTLAWHRGRDSERQAQLRYRPTHDRDTGVDREPVILAAWHERHD